MLKSSVPHCVYPDVEIYVEKSNPSKVRVKVAGKEIKDVNEVAYTHESERHYPRVEILFFSQKILKFIANHVTVHEE